MAVGLVVGSNALPGDSLMFLIRSGFCLALALLPALACADWTEGRTKLGVEFELEKGAGNAWQSRGLTLVPGIASIESSFALDQIKYSIAVPV